MATSSYWVGSPPRLGVEGLVFCLQSVSKGATFFFSRTPDLGLWQRTHSYPFDLFCVFWVQSFFAPFLFEMSPPL